MCCVCSVSRWLFGGRNIELRVRKVNGRNLEVVSVMIGKGIWVGLFR